MMTVSATVLPAYSPTLQSLLHTASVAEFRAIKSDASTAPLPGGLERVFVLELDSSVTVEDAIKKIQGIGDFEYVEPDYVGYGGGEHCAEETGRTFSLAFVPNDPQFGNQWGLRNTGQMIGGVTGKSGADINAAPAWGLSTGTSDLLLAVLDSGIPQNAADFAGRIVPGYDYVNNDSDPTDDLGHGSNVTSIAAATGNNGTVMAGMNWNCRIIHFKILNSSNSGLYSWWASALYAAADSGARVISMSVGGTGASSTLQSAVQYAAAKGAIITACMMNTNNEVSYYPSAYPEVIAVGATNNLDVRAVPFCFSPTSGSNYGTHLDFMAPGERILGLYYLDPTQVSYWCGTSQATPMVAGVISLMRGLKPDLTFQQIYDILKVTSRDQVGPAGEDTPGWDKYFGWGCVDAYAALQQVKNLVSVEALAEIPTGFWLGQNYPNPFNPATAICYTVTALSPGRTRGDEGSAIASLRIYDMLGREVAVLVSERKPAGTYTVTWDAWNMPSGVYFCRLTAGSFTQIRRMLLMK